MKETLVLILILIILLSEMASSESWSGYVKTAGGTWNIHRHSNNVSFKSDQYVEGKIKAFEGPRGRVLSPYCSYFGDMDLNDVRLKGRTAALEGNYSSDGITEVRSKVKPPVRLNIDKSVGSNIYTIDFMEDWPVDISSRRSLEYSGKGINDRDFSGNNLDFVRADLLYNKNLSKNLIIGMELERMNATVLATDYGIIQAEIKPTRDLNFKLSARTTGIADLKYQQSGPEFDRDSVTGYEIFHSGDERYYGSFNMMMDISMKSRFEDLRTYDSWLPCCYQGWTDMSLFDRRALNADGIFDCTCSSMQGVKP
jgi:hypothetical protein